MHELGIVDGILRTIVHAAHEAQAERIMSARLRIGDLREVVPESLDFAWSVLREDDPLTAWTTLEVERVHPRSACPLCGEEFDHDRFHVRCPQCGCAETQLIRGRELDLVSIEIETDT